MLRHLLLLSALFFLAACPAIAQVSVNEYSCANWKLTSDNYGEHGDWIELYNASAGPVDLGGWWLSDRKETPKKWAFPAGTSIAGGGFLLVWASGRNEAAGGHYHTNFRLSQTRNTPERIVLSRADGSLVSDLKIEKTKVHQSYCRQVDGGANWRYALQPTPGKTNTGARTFKQFADRPDFDQTPGFYEGPVTVAITTSDPALEIRYTVDGTEPGPSSPAYKGPLQLTKTSVLKAKSFSSSVEVQPSFTEYGTFFIGEHHSLPWVVSVAGDSLTDLANGADSIRPIGSIEIYGLDKDRKTRAYGELNSHGQDSWVNDQRSIDWVTRDEFGYNYALREQLFPELTQRDEFQRIILRAAGDDNYPGGSGYPFNPATGEPLGTPLSAHVRDAYLQNLAKKGGLNVDTRSAEKAIVYLNGEYWGVYDLREIPDDHDYTEYNFGQDKYDLQYLLTWDHTWAEYGDSLSTLEEWRNFYQYVNANSLTDTTKWAYVKSQLDYTSMADYFIVNSFAVASDWLTYNTGWWRGLNPAGGAQKWRFILWDLDATFAYYINYTGIQDTGATARPCNVDFLNLNTWHDPNPQRHLRILQKLRLNKEFRQYYVTRMHDLSRTTFGCENMLAELDAIIAAITPEMPRHIERWGGSMEEWARNVRTLRSFVERRCAYLPTGIKSCYNLTGPYPTLITADPPEAGSLELNTLTYTQFPVSNAYFGNIDLKLNALPRPNAGYRFTGWSAKNHPFIAPPEQAQNALRLTKADTIVAHFERLTPTEEAAAPDVALRVYPSLVRETLTLEYTLAQNTALHLQLVSALGAEMATFPLPSQEQSAGTHALVLDFARKNLSPGVYFLSLSDGRREWTTKVVYLGR